MNNLIILTKENINDFNINEKHKQEILTYAENNAINKLSKFEMAIDSDTKQMYARHITMNRIIKSWEPYPFN